MNVYLVPTSDQVAVRDPINGKPLPKEGAFKPRSAYWLRRLRDKDVAESKPPKKPAEKPALAVVTDTTKGDK